MNFYLTFGYLGHRYKMQCHWCRRTTTALLLAMVRESMFQLERNILALGRHRQVVKWRDGWDEVTRRRCQANTEATAVIRIINMKWRLPLSFSSWTENTQFIINDPCWRGHITYYTSYRIASMDEESCKECYSSHVVWANISLFKIKYNDIYIYIYTHIYIYDLSSDRKYKTNN